MSLSDLVEIMVNNEECVVLKVKDNVSFDLIALGCFDGNESMLRITKGKNHTATVFRKDKTFSWDWGERGQTLVTEQLHKMGQLIQSCVEEDFGIYIGDNPRKIKETLYIKFKSDKSKMKHVLEILYWSNWEENKGNNMGLIILHKDKEFFRSFPDLKKAQDYIAEHYVVESMTPSVAKTGCFVETYQTVCK